MSGTSKPAGTVSFYSNQVLIGKASLVNGEATLSSSSLPEGSQVVNAIYTGSTHFEKSSSNSISVKITTKSGPSTLVNTTTTVTSSTTQADQGFTISLTAKVATSNAAGTPTGDVVFSIGEKKLGTVALSNGKAYLNIANLPTGNDQITASYAGNTTFAASSSAAIMVKITGPDFTVEATPAQVTAKAGESVTVALLITPKNGFNQAPQLSCSGMPEGTTCTFASAKKQADGTSIVDMAIHTAATTSALHRPETSKAPFALALLPLLFWLSPRRRREFNRLMSLSMLALAIVMLGGSAIGCGGKATTKSSTVAADSSTTITVTAKTSNGINHTADVLLTLM
jgi:hypothetical protein